LYKEHGFGAAAPQTVKQWCKPFSDLKTGHKIKGRIPAASMEIM
jgi:hypothetical protein